MRKVNIEVFIRWTQTQLQMNANVASYLLDEYTFTVSQAKWQHLVLTKPTGTGYHNFSVHMWRTLAQKAIFSNTILGKGVAVKLWINLLSYTNLKWPFLLSEFDPFGWITFGKSRGAIWLNYFIPFMCVGSQQEVRKTCSAGPKTRKRDEACSGFFGICTKRATFVRMDGAPSLNAVSILLNTSMILTHQWLNFLIQQINRKRVAIYCSC